MGFKFPKYNPPDFNEEKFLNAEDVKISKAETDGIAPYYYHSTSIYPEYFKIDGKWILAEESRMDCVVIRKSNGTLNVVEARNIRCGDEVILGRDENCSEGIYVHTNGFLSEEPIWDNFVFRSNRSRETAYSKDYDDLYELLKYEKNCGNVLWVMGPAFSFDADARFSMQRMIEEGYVHGVLAGNALATHDLEGGLFKTALGQDIYTQRSMPNGHYNHLDVINLVRKSGSIPRFIQDHNIKDGIMYGLVKMDIPFVLAGSIRDDGPLPEVISNVYEAQGKMRSLIKTATTVICLATQLHTIATGNMTPSFRVVDGIVRPLYTYSIDVSEFAVNKLADRGSLSTISFVTNVQDFIVHVAKGLKIYY
ncbi:MAG: hypothetical protein FWC47_13690 [Oscillospiraceae bacterium]|nr:hypothetical protein [Oscillospiraceae bacterium]